MLLRVEYVVWNSFALEQVREMLRALHRCGANEDWLPRSASLLDVFHDGAIFGALRAVDKIGLVIAHHRSVRWNGGHLKVVDLAELLSLGHGGTGHAGELAVETEVVLEGDRCECHRLTLYV